jgi:hypothetical protein
MVPHTPWFPQLLMATNLASQLPHTGQPSMAEHVQSSNWVKALMNVGTYSSMQLRQAASPCPDVPAQLANALATSSHPEDAAAMAGATAGGNVAPGEMVGAGATGPDGNDGTGTEYGQPKKQSDPQMHASYARTPR